MDGHKRSSKAKHWFHDIQPKDQESLNLVEFPLALLARSIPSSQKTISFEDSIFDKSIGQRIKRKLTISANVETSLPNYWDQDVLIALSVLTWRKNRFTDPVVEFTLREVLRLMGVSGQGANCKRLAKSFDNWLGLRFKWSHWWSGESWDHPKATVLIQDYDLTRKPGNSSPTAPQVFAWSRLYFEAMQGGKCKPFDGDFYFGLKSPTTKRLYRYLDKRFFNRVDYSSPVASFCTEKLGIARGRKPSQYPAKINKAYDELIACGYLADFPKCDRYVRDKNGLLMVNFRRGRGQQKTTKPKRQSTATPVERSPIEQSLIDFGMTASTATKFAQSKPEECTNQIEFMEFQISTGWKPSKGTGAYLNSAIQESYDAPKDFVSKAQRELEAAAIAKARKEREAAALHKQQMEDEAKAKKAAAEEEQWAAIMAYLNGLSSDDYDACIEAAIKTIVPLHRKRARQDFEQGLDGIYIQMALRQYVLPLMDEAAAK